ncbi:MAG: hypothetical protein HQL46_13370 [Gammaproteobacteria bacterium]|nr:hypothetical protein [Gammaproteobacteria bacterium]
MNNLFNNEYDDYQIIDDVIEFQMFTKTEQKHETRMRIEDYLYQKELIKQLKEENIFWDKSDFFNGIIND